MVVHEEMYPIVVESVRNLYAAHYLRRSFATERGFDIPRYRRRRDERFIEYERPLTVVGVESVYRLFGDIYMPRSGRLFLLLLLDLGLDAVYTL